MVMQVTSLSRSGVADWMIQRVSAVILAAYTVLLVLLIGLTPDLDYMAWRGLFEHTWMKVASLLALLALCGHAWVGMWTIGTDYIREHYFGRAANGVRLAYQIGCGLLIIVYLIWGTHILWGA